LTALTVTLQITSSTTSFHNQRALLKKIDTLPTGPEWECVTFEVDGTDANGDPTVEEVDLWRRDPVECVKELLANPAFKNKCHYKPKRVFTDKSKTNRAYNEMWTGDWWWELQVRSSLLEIMLRECALMNE